MLAFKTDSDCLESITDHCGIKNIFSKPLNFRKKRINKSNMKNLSIHSEPTRLQTSRNAWGCLIAFNDYKTVGVDGEKSD